MVLQKDDHLLADLSHLFLNVLFVVLSKELRFGVMSFLFLSFFREKDLPCFSSFSQGVLESYEEHISFLVIKLLITFEDIFLSIFTHVLVFDLLLNLIENNLAFSIN